MTTQHTHHEHGDVDASTVEQSSAPETTVNPISSQTDTSAHETTHTGNAPTASQPASTSEEQSENQQDQSSAQHKKHKSATSQRGQERSESDVLDAGHPSHGDRPSHKHEAEKIAQNDAHFADTLSLTEKEEEVRPFTDFIEEFRQAEARLSASVQESKSAAFSLFPPITEQPSLSKEQVAPSESAPLNHPSETLLEKAREEATDSPSHDILPSPTTMASSQTTEAADQTKAEVASQPSESANEDNEPKTSLEEKRAVSPLLRPATRLRVPRHGGARHHQRELPPVEPKAQSSKQETQAEQQNTLSPTESTPSTVEQIKAVDVENLSAKEEKPKPTRRYRFDRPGTAKGTTSTSQATQPSPTEDNGALTASTDSNLESTNSASETPVQAETQSKSQEEPLPTQPSLQESSIKEKASPLLTTQESGNRHGKESSKQSPSPSNMAEVTMPVVEATTQTGEIAPEDLPPLEYSELQKASSRRRRRHRSGSNNNVSSTPQETPAIPSPDLPHTAAASNQYTIISGYTVNQMNMGKEVAGPFMGPDPSPARGSGTTRESRVNRTEIVRTPAPTYPVRTALDNGLTSPAINQFANAISQAIQTQTDRMVAEFRRLSQAPTNVSVSLPPFPSNERVGVFVDVANLLYSARTMRIAIDFGKLLDFLRGNRRLVRAHAYCPTSPQPGDEQMFLQAVKGLGYRITTKNYKTFSSGAKKADLDLDLCMDVVRLVDGKAVDCVVLVSGDSDFMPMLDYCSDHGVRVEVAAFDEAMSATLRQSCDLFINLSMLEEIRS